MADEANQRRRVFRFAPSPNGHLHLGHARSALLNFDLAQECGGRFLLRIEDIDQTRCKPEYEAAIYEDLAWLGLRWEHPVRRQSEHFADYAPALERLQRDGLIYRSFETRAELARAAAVADAPRDPDGAVAFRGAPLPSDEEARRIAAGEPFAWRLMMDKAMAHAGPLQWLESGHETTGGYAAARPDAYGDVVLARKDSPTSYHLAVVIDDALQGVTDVVRGVDLYHATSIHRLLQQLLGLPEPRYLHHALIRDVDGAKLSKSTQATALRELRGAGYSPAEVRRLAGLDEA